jgi:hypothetical protein
MRHIGAKPEQYRRISDVSYAGLAMLDWLCWIGYAGLDQMI